LNDSNSEVVSRTRNLVLIQASAGIVVALVFAYLNGFAHALSAIYGTAVSMVGVLLLSTDIRRANSRAVDHPKSSMGVLYFGAAQRFIVILVLLVIGLAVLKLQAVAVLSGFALAQLGFVVQLRKLAQQRR
jgi:ATP synthase protein I